MFLKKYPAFLSLIFLSLFLAISPRALAADQPSAAVTGKDWLLMSDREKVTYLSSAINTLQSKGILLNQSPNDYLAAINRLSDNPKYLSLDATNILASYVYDTEPSAKEAIDRLRKKSEVKKIEMH